MLFPSCSTMLTKAGNKGGNFPKIHFDESFYDFGIAGREQKIVHKYTFRNAGRSELTIERIEVPCNCEARVLQKKDFNAGEEGIIEVEITTGKYQGKIQREFIVISNDPDTPRVNLTMAGMIKSGVGLKPEVLYFDQVKRGETPMRSFKVIQLEKDDLAIKKIQGEEKYFTISWTPFRDENAKGFEVTVTLKNTIPSGTLREVITIHTNVRKQPRIDVPVFVDIF